MAETYCLPADLEKFFTKIGDYDLKETLLEDEFTLQAGVIWQLGSPGDVVVFYIAGVNQGAPAANLGAIGSDYDWFFDATNEILYVQLPTGTEPTDYSMARAPQDWEDTQATNINFASEWIESVLDWRIPRPIPRMEGSKEGGSYDFAVQAITAIKACHQMVMATDPTSSDVELLWNQLYNEAETGLVDMVNSGKIKLSFEQTPSDASGQIKEVSIDAATTGFITDLIGEPTVAYDIFLIVIAVGGTLAAGTENSTITYTVTNSQGEAVLTTELVDGQFQELGGGIRGRFSPGDYTANDTWSMSVQGLGQDTGTIRSVELKRK
jgi:hypothetical protein